MSHSSSQSLPAISSRELLISALSCLGLLSLVWWVSAFVVNREVAATLSDNSWYILMAQGDYNVPKPFNTRIVLPWLAGHLSTSTGISLGSAFLSLQLTAFFLLHVFAALAMRRLFGFGLLRCVWITGLCLATQGFVWLVGATYYPDLLFLAWTAVAIWAWLGQRWWLVILSLFLALITRDSSALPLALIIFVGAFIQRQKLGMAVPFLAVAAQQAFFKLVYAPGAGNVHGLGELLYLPLKLITNSSRAYFGLRMWSNTLGDNPITGPSNPMPATTFDLPTWMHLGGIRKVGFYPWSFDLIVITFVQMAVTFGLPLIIALVLARRLAGKKERLATHQGLGLHGTLLLIYGIMMLFLGPATGTDIPRLIMAAWPCAVLIGAGWLAAQSGSARTWTLLALSCITGWILHFAWRASPDMLIVAPSTIIGCLFLLAFGAAVVMKTGLGRDPSIQTSASQS